MTSQNRYDDSDDTDYRHIRNEPAKFDAVPKSWGDVVALALLLSMILSGLAWGLKLEMDGRMKDDRMLRIEQEQSTTKLQIAKGILPMTEERLNVLTQKIAELSKIIEMQTAEISELKEHVAELNVYHPRKNHGSSGEVFDKAPTGARVDDSVPPRACFDGIIFAIMGANYDGWHCPV